MILQWLKRFLFQRCQAEGIRKNTRIPRGSIEVKHLREITVRCLKVIFFYITITIYKIKMMHYNVQNIDSKFKKPVKYLAK